MAEVRRPIEAEIRRPIDNESRQPVDVTIRRPVDYVAAVRRISWGAALAGVAIALVTQLGLSLLGVGIGVSTIDPLTGDTPRAATDGRERRASAHRCRFARSASSEPPRTWSGAAPTGRETSCGR